MRREPYYKFKHVKSIPESLGLSTSGFKLYEKAGIIKPAFNPENGYRELELEDGILMLMGLIYTKYGLTLKETAHMLHSTSLEKQLEALEKQYALINKEIVFKLHVQETLAEQLLLLREFNCDPLACRIVTLDPIYYMPIHDHEMRRLFKEMTHSAKWAKGAPFVAGTRSISLEDWNNHNEKLNIDHGMSVFSKYMPYLNLPLEYAQIFSEQNSCHVQGFVCCELKDIHKRDNYKHIEAYIEKRSLIVCGDILCRMITYENRDGSSMNCAVVWFPILTVHA